MTAVSVAEVPPHVLREYALLADGERGALIGPRGDISWMCAPRWHDGAVFSALIGGRGVFSVTPRCQFVWGGYYEDGSLVWRSRWVTTDGIIECREALAFPGEPDRVVLMRRLLAVRGEARASLTFAPAADFGSRGMTNAFRDDDHGSWHADAGDLRVRLTGLPRRPRSTNARVASPLGQNSTWPKASTTMSSPNSPPDHGAHRSPRPMSCGRAPKQPGAEPFPSWTPALLCVTRAIPTQFSGD